MRARDESIQSADRGHALARRMHGLFDDDFPLKEQLPRSFRVVFTEIKEGSCPRVVLTRDDRPVGDALTDNSYTDDGYRFHDVFHFGLAALLGWSPMTRRLFGCKRRSNPMIDEVEDGGRARVIEEAVCALMYDYARKHGYLAAERSIEARLLDTVRSLTSDREVKVVSSREWELAALEIYDVWRQMWANCGGAIEADLIRGRLTYSADCEVDPKIRTTP